VDYKPGMKIGRYVLDKCIGDGGEAEVWKAYFIDNRNFLCALKLRRPVLLNERDDVSKQNQAFVRENNRWVEFSRSSIYVVNILDLLTETAEDDEGNTWVIHGTAAEYSEIGDLHNAIKEKKLRQYLTSRGHVSIEVSFIEFLLKIISGVKAGHTAQIVHCDIKPLNILLFRDGDDVVPKLTDFGIALSPLETIRGYTPGYAAPELSPGGKPAREMDVYSLGITFYEIFFASILEPTSNLKTAGDYTSGREYKKYITANFDVNGDQAGLDAVPYLKLIASMADENPENRPTLDSISEWLTSTLWALRAKGRQYRVKTPADQYLWNPLVHEVLQEKLYYIMVKGGNPNVDVRDILTDMSRENITGFSLRSVTGEWDNVVRVWISKAQSSLERLVERISHNGRTAVPLEVQAAELHHAPPKRLAHSNSDVRLLREIEACSKGAKDEKDALTKLRQGGYIAAALNNSDKSFRVTLVVTIAPSHEQLAPVVGELIRKKIKSSDKRAREVSYYDVKPVGTGSRNIRLLVKFMHSDFASCRKTLTGVFSSLVPFGNHFGFSTLLDMNAGLDCLSDDGVIISRIQAVHAGGNP
jgi:serine/threonine protein kinase